MATSIDELLRGPLASTLPPSNSCEAMNVPSLPSLRLGYTDFWRGFNAETYFLTTLLRRRFNVTLSDDPDLLIFSVFGKGDFLRYSCKRMMFIAENVRPDFAAADFVISSDLLEHPRHFRSPWWAQWMSAQDLVVPAGAVPTVPSPERKFCSIVVSNPNSLPRLRFLERLSRYKPVDSGGFYMNNVGGPVPNKVAFIRNYKFNICFENSSHPGYTTEKLPEALLARTVPIYWGDPVVDREFDPASFIWIRDLRHVDDAIERIIAADRDDAEYARYFTHPPLRENKVPPHCDRDFSALVDFLEQAALATITPVARSPMCRAVARVRRTTRFARQWSRAFGTRLRQRLGG